MRRSALLLALAVPLASAPAVAQIVIPKAPAPAASSLPTKVGGLGPRSFEPLEKNFDYTLKNIGGNDPMELLGGTRGVYLEGYGVVFTTEVSLAYTTSINPFHQQITPEESANVHKVKVAHLPLLKKAMQQMMLALATGLDSLPSDQQIVLAVRVLYMPWENTTGLPGQILMRADRRTLLSNVGSESGIRTEEQ
jgi:hypothetical protein